MTQNRDPRARDPLWLAALRYVPALLLLLGVIALCVWVSTWNAAGR